MINFLMSFSINAYIRGKCVRATMGDLPNTIICTVHMDLRVSRSKYIEGLVIPMSFVHGSDEEKATKGTDFQ